MRQAKDTEAGMYSWGEEGLVYSYLLVLILTFFGATVEQMISGRWQQNLPLNYDLFIAPIRLTLLFPAENRLANLILGIQMVRAEIH